MIRHNHPAIWLLAVFNLLLLVLWYSPVMFYHPWSEDMGFNVPGYIPRDNLPYVTVVVSFIVLHYFISWFVQVLHKDTWKKGAGAGLLLFSGFAAPLIAARYKPLNISMAVLAIDLAFILVMLLLSSSILAVWRKQEE